MGISTKLASKYEVQLEKRPNAQLLHRTTRSVTLTETGAACYKHGLPLLDQFDEQQGAVQENPPISRCFHNTIPCCKPPPDIMIMGGMGSDGSLNIAVSGSSRANSPFAIAHMAADGLSTGLYAVYPPSRHLTARIRALIDHLIAQFSGR